MLTHLLHEVVILLSPPLEACELLECLLNERIPQLVTSPVFSSEKLAIS